MTDNWDAPPQESQGEDELAALRAADTDAPPPPDVPRETVDAGVPADSRIERARVALDAFIAQHPTLAHLVADIRKALA